MPRLFILIPALVSLIIISVLFMSNQEENPKVLVFSKTAGFYHESIPDGIAAIKKLGEENGYNIDETTDANDFNEENLNQYSAVIFLSTTGDVLNQYQEADFERFIQSGGGYVGVHSAADTEYHWGWYGRLVGGYFLDHPRVQEATLNIEDNCHPSTEFLPEQWVRVDEWYSYKDMNEDVNVLITLDEESYQTSEEMGYHPIAWYHEFDGGRAFYTGGGHTSESFDEELFLEHLNKGIQYAIGDQKLNQSKAKTQRVPEENRFNKVSLVEGGVLLEPTEMAILPNSDVLVAQRRGEITLYKNNNGAVSEAGFLDVYWKTEVPNVNAEEGVIGIEADPNFEDNRFVYIFYTPADTSVNRLSRFKFVNDHLDMDSETVVLEFYSQRNICCHTGGSMAFGSDGLLYISTGDNATPFNQPNQPYVLNGYAPLDDRPGFEQYDARRTSGNTNDLRGKILRIKVNEDGSYDIPEGNLYPEGMNKTRPEIYIQGNRNPYRISLDPKNNYLYWGEVGPDARADSVGLRGSLGYDEINQARGAGHYGWPFFVGNNFPYNEYDYATGTTGSVFNPEKPVNNSPNNTGIVELPPAQPAFIWYPYSASNDFPEVGTGGRNAMAGPVYYTDLYPEETRLPGYFNGKLFIYDWIRDWIKVVTLQPNGDFDKMEPFLGSTTLNSLVDMEVGPDGKLYLLEYGNGWFSKNEDSGLSRIDYNSGNRAPVVHSLKADKITGLPPFDVTFTVDAEDPENDPLTFLWDLGGEQQIETNKPRLDYTFGQIGDNEVSVEVRDPDNLAAISEPISVYSGNAAPIVHIDIKGNRTFYFPDKEIDYNVRIEDENPDGVSSSIDPSNLFVSADYSQMEEGGNEAETSEGHQIMSDVLIGKSMVTTLDCRACHHETGSSIGPTYTNIADRYRDSTNVVSYLTNKIINGSSGVWGPGAMPAHMDMKEEDAQKIVAWIRSLGDDIETTVSLPASNILEPVLGEELIDNGIILISASYTDEGGHNIKPLTGSTTLALRSNVINAASGRNLHNYTVVEYRGDETLRIPADPGSFSINKIDLSGINAIEILGNSREVLDSGYTFEIRLDKPNGTLIGEGVLQSSPIENVEEILQAISVNIEPITDGHLHDVYFVTSPVNESESEAYMIRSITFQM